MGASASIVGSDAGSAAPILLFTVIDFLTRAQMKHHSALMATALETLQQHKGSATSTTNANSNGRGSSNSSSYQYDKVFALEQTGGVQTTLVEVAVPSRLWDSGSGGSGAAAAAASATTEDPPDPDLQVTVGGVEGGIRCLSWVGTDGGRLPVEAEAALKRRGVTVAGKLAGFCYGSSFQHCNLFIHHQCVWKSEEAVKECVGGRGRPGERAARCGV
jgi:hypothetical protein